MGGMAFLSSSRASVLVKIANEGYLLFILAIMRLFFSSPVTGPMKKPCKTLCIRWASPGAFVGTACMKVLRKGSFEVAAAVLVDANDGDEMTAGTCKRGLLVLG
jgi:hypothetical protein